MGSVKIRVKSVRTSENEFDLICLLVMNEILLIVGCRSTVCRYST